MSRVLLMTATINPTDTRGLAVSDPVARREQYERALIYYVNEYGDMFDGIVFAENSGADLTGLRKLVWPRLNFELISTPSTLMDPTVGRGYAETILVADAFERSELLQQSGARAIKVTGRYRVKNLAAMLESMSFDLDGGFNTRLIPSAWTDMAVYFAKASLMQQIRLRAEVLREGESHISAERSLGGVLDALDSQELGYRVQRRFGAEPRIEGVRGWDGRAYHSGKQSAKWALRAAAKKVAPRVWI